MYNYLRNIDDTIESYPLDYLDCFERPSAIVLDSLLENGGSMYIMITKLLKSFYLFNEITQDDVSDLISKNFGINCYNIPVEDHLIASVIDCLNEGNPVLVPGNLKMLYYSEHYMINDWRHLFLIKGYDDERKIFKIVDSTQQPPRDDIIHYTDFFLKFEDLCLMFKGLPPADQYITYYKLSESPIESMSSLLFIVNQLQQLLSENKHIETNILQIIKEDTTQNSEAFKNSIINDVINISKYKMILLEQLSKLLDIYKYDTTVLNKITKSLEKHWRISAISSIKSVFQPNYKTAEYKLTTEAVEAEQALIHELDNCINYLKHTTSEHSIVSKYSIENNEDAIVSQDNGQYLFNFHTDRVYNMWISDHCPKVIVYTNKNHSRHLSFSLKFKVDSQPGIIGHQEGIYLRTNHDFCYTLAMNHLNQYVFDFVGKYTINTYNNPQPMNEYHIYMILEETTLSYGIIDHDGNYQKVGDFELVDEITHLGFFCKTWDHCTQLKVSFSDIKFDSQIRNTLSQSVI
jgi:hypothetical protein